MSKPMAEPFPLLTARFERSPNAGKARCEPAWHWRPHQPLRDYDLWYAVAGKGMMNINGTAYPIRKGSCFLIRPGDRPEATQDPHDRLTVIFIHFTMTDSGTGQLFDGSLLPDRHTRVGDTLFIETMLNRLLQITKPESSWDDVEYRLAMMQILLHLYRWQREEHASSADKQKQVIARVIGYIREHPGRRIAHREIAAHVQLSAEYVSTLFKKHTGTSIKQYMTDVRLERALHLLMETTMNVSQVAEALGYANVYLFSKQFKERYGAPPSKYKWGSEPSRAHGRDTSGDSGHSAGSD
ncbi:helix-turn-helix transcriptional regulator [Paenibacillus piri]|uniref:AraC family transcriptional regulator n=1 Tax=Paenibacillus piri TaxID=2547395 RepID=A0A4R5KEG1_9BACL|nr:AraC family transcriptional regulator [Paenibacillus piri]TDF93769.1 AraC family transcriptional regulator [Paenibacillus piri]